MGRYEFRMPRLYVETDLDKDAALTLPREPSHYLANVLRMTAGDFVLLFNGRDGEWRASIESSGKKGVSLKCVNQLRDQPPDADLLYAFAPLKHARLDYMVQKAVEMGASALQPVITQHTQVARVNPDRMRANMIEAAEQCGVLALPALYPEKKLLDFLGALETDRLLIFCDEDCSPGNAFATLRDAHRAKSSQKIAVLIGPEGGFSEGERQSIVRFENHARISLGPRILRADTAAVASLALVQAVLGDWR
jgi:16S rRNA (uracil1498-N3)-methyltransferase